MTLKTTLITALLAIFILSPSAWATTKKTPSSCAEVGSAKVKCYQCSGTKKYLGDVPVLTAYEKDQGKDFCVRANDARSACASKFGVSKWSIGFYTKFSIGSGTSEEFYNTSCVKEVGY